MPKGSKAEALHGAEEPHNHENGEGAKEQVETIDNFNFCGRPAQVTGGVLNLFALFGHNDFTPVYLGAPNDGERRGVRRHTTADGCYHIIAGASYSVVTSQTRRLEHLSCGRTAASTKRYIRKEPQSDDDLCVEDNAQRPVKARGGHKRVNTSIVVTSAHIIDTMRASKSQQGETQPKALTSTRKSSQTKQSLEPLKPSIVHDEEDVPITLPRRYGTSPQPAEHNSVPAPIHQRSRTTRSPILAAPSASRTALDSRTTSHVNSAAFPRGDSSAVAEQRGGASMSMPPPSSAFDRLAPSPSPAPFVAPAQRLATAGEQSVAKRSSSLSRAVAAAPRVDADATDDEDRPMISLKKDKKEKHEKKDKKETKKEKEKKETNSSGDRRSRSRSLSQAADVVRPTIATVPAAAPAVAPQPPSKHSSSFDDNISASIIGMKQPSMVSQSSSDPPSFLLPPQKVPPAKRQRSPSTPPQLRPDVSSHRSYRGSHNGSYRGHSIDESPALGYTRVVTKLTQFSLDPSEDSDSD
ncbi:Hypothetical protein, putative [Bodo saltans]|uniref:Uncharacterized protein n=1 Tax=Bodo saltans TaxID=75058 RepID=A0A0S4KHE7_BODSA|nr:Hypothetical protein, putative [Bodo saltans]|eukprot:CUI15131.1 Hypothetical protein, putative [Bodo saltans]